MVSINEKLIRLAVFTTIDTFFLTLLCSDLQLGSLLDIMEELEDPVLSPTITRVPQELNGRVVLRSFC